MKGFIKSFILLAGGFFLILASATATTRVHNSETSELMKELERNRLLTHEQAVRYCGTTIVRRNFSDANRDEQQRIFKLVNNSVVRGSTTLIDLAQEEDPDFLGWVQVYINYAAVWLVFLAFSVVFLIFFTIARACNRYQCCHRHRCAKCWPCFPSNTRKYLRLEVTLLIVLALGLAACTIANFVYISRVQAGYQGSTCAAMVALNMINSGNRNFSWGGLSYMAYHFQNAFPLISEAYQHTEIGFGDNTTLIIDNTSFVTQISSLYTNWDGTKVISPSPWAATTITPDIFSVRLILFIFVESYSSH